MARKRGKKAEPRKVGKVSPPLVPFAHALPAVPAVIEHAQPDPVKAFRAFVQRPFPDIGSRAIGNADDLAAVYMNALAGETTPIDLARELKRRGVPVCERANAAAHNTITASKIVDSALLLHLRPEGWHDHTAIALARTALEGAGRAVLIAHGTSDEPERFENGDGFRARDCVDALTAVAAKREARASPPLHVYGWLCRYGHMNYRAFEPWLKDQTVQVERAYAALAYVSWAIAIAAEVVTGMPVLAKWPTRLPAPLPWDLP